MASKVSGTIICKADTPNDFDAYIHKFINRQQYVIFLQQNIRSNGVKEKDPFGQIVSLNKFAEDLSILLEDYE